MNLEKKTTLSIEMSEMEGYCIAEILNRAYHSLEDEFEKSVVQQYLTEFGFVIAPSEEFMAPQYPGHRQESDLATDLMIKANRHGSKLPFPDRKKD